MVWHRNPAVAKRRGFRWRRVPWWCFFLAYVLVIAVVAVVLRSNQSVRETDPQKHAKIVIASGLDVTGNVREQLVKLWNDAGRITAASGDPGYPTGYPQAEIEELSPIADQQYADMLAAAQEKRGRYDLLNLDVPWIAEFAENGYLRQVSSHAEQRFNQRILPQPLDAGRIDGSLYAVPFNTDVGLLYYRRDILRDEQLPKTWRDLFKWCAGISARNWRKWGLQACYAGQFADYEGLTVNALEMAWGAGGQLTESDGDLATDRDTTRAIFGLQRLADRRAGGRHPFLLRDAPSQHEQESLDAFEDHQVVFMRNWPYANRELDSRAADRCDNGRIDKTEGDSGSLNFGVAPLPAADGTPASVGHAALGGQSLAMSADSGFSPKVLEALIDFLTSSKRSTANLGNQERLFREGGLAPVDRSLYNDRALTRDCPIIKTLAIALSGARPRPKSRYYTDLSRAIRKHLYLALAGSPLDSDNLLGDVQQSLHGRLGR